jgi:hypothetical protein
VCPNSLIICSFELNEFAVRLKHYEKSIQCTSLRAFNDTNDATRCTMVCGISMTQTKQTTLVDRHVPYIIPIVQIMYSYKSLLISK